MAFSDFKKIPDVQKKFGIRHIENDFIKAAPQIILSQHALSWVNSLSARR